MRRHVPGGQNYDGTGVQLQRGADGSHGAGLGGLSGARSKVTQLIEDVEVRNSNLGQQTGVGHHLDGLARVVTLGGLTRQHDTVSAVENSVGDIGNLGTSGTGVVCHGLQHLGGTDDGLALDVALGDHHLLGKEHLGGGDLNTEITTGNHDTVGLLEDLIEVVDTLLVLDLGNDLDLLTLLAEDGTDVLDVLAATNERGKDHVDLVLDTELQVGNILRGQSGEVYVSAGKVDTLTGRDVAVVQALDLEVLLINNLDHLERQNAVVDIDELSGRDHTGDVLVVEVPIKQRLSVSAADPDNCRRKNSTIINGRSLTCSCHHWQWRMPRRW